MCLGSFVHLGSFHRGGPWVGRLLHPGVDRSVLGRSYTWSPSTAGDSGSGDPYLPDGFIRSARPGIHEYFGQVDTHTMQDPPMTCRGSFVSLDPFGITVERL